MFILAICLTLTRSSITLLKEKTSKQKSPKKRTKIEINCFFRSLLGAERIVLSPLTVNSSMMTFLKFTLFDKGFSFPDVGLG